MAWAEREREDDWLDAFCASLLKSGHVSEAGLARAHTIAASEHKRVDQVLTGLGLVGERDLAGAYAHLLDLPCLDPQELKEDPTWTEEFNAVFLQRMKVLPLGEAGDTYRLAMVDPLNDEAVEAVRFIVHRDIARVVMTEAQFDEGFAKAFGSATMAADLDATFDMVAASLDTSAVQKLRDSASEAPVIRLLNNLVARAIETRASDIHIEPDQGSARVRMRIDGALQLVPVPPVGIDPLISRAKIMAGLDIAERRLPQDGRMTQAVRGREIDFRVSTVPTLTGESVVLRVLDPHAIALDYDVLGFTKAQVGRLRRIMNRPNGIVLVTGPTGSGKTTTLYTALSELNGPQAKVLTIEDPVEYQLQGINQAQVNTKVGLTFASALRSFLRQDPDIMMVGEIRDLETAEVAIQAALTGHLVLSTLHTNDALGAVARLIDLGAEDFLIASTVSGLMAQRLVRTLCTECREPYTPPKEIVGPLGAINPNVTLYKPKGCGACQNSGFKGRTVIAEILEISEELRTEIARGASLEVLREMAKAQGFEPMARDGFEKAERGITSLDEVFRVCQAV